MKLSELKKMRREWLSMYKDNLISADWKEYAGTQTIITELREKLAAYEATNYGVLVARNAKLEAVAAAALPFSKLPEYREPISNRFIVAVDESAVKKLATALAELDKQERK